MNNAKPCPTCGAEMVEGDNGAACLPCFNTRGAWPEEWEDDFCRSGNCRGRTKDRPGFPIRVRKGTPRKGNYRYCNECFCR